MSDQHVDFSLDHLVDASKFLYCLSALVIYNEDDNFAYKEHSPFTLDNSLVTKFYYSKLSSPLTIEGYLKTL
jgi:hypothetical protein